MSEHPVEHMMEYPFEGCECANCTYAYWFDALSAEEKRAELDSMAAYSAEAERYE